jgi:hypothetical protein
MEDAYFDTLEAMEEVRIPYLNLFHVTKSMILDGHCSKHATRQDTIPIKDKSIHT